MALKWQACRGSINLATAELTVCRDALHFDVSGLNGTIYLKADSLAQRQKWVGACLLPHCRARGPRSLNPPQPAQVLAIANVKSRGESGNTSRRPSVPTTPTTPTHAGGSSSAADRIESIRRELLAAATEFEVTARRVESGDTAVNASTADEARQLAHRIGDGCLRLVDELRGLSVAPDRPLPGGPGATKPDSPSGTPFMSPTGVLEGDASAASVPPTDAAGVVGSSVAQPSRLPEEQTFFSEVHDFSGVLTVTDGGPCSIDAAKFLAAASALLPFLDRLGSALAIVKSDISGNIEKVRKAFDKGNGASLTLADIVREEVKEKRTSASDSASDALLWLKRALRFICAFMGEFADGKETASAAGVAYSRTLAHYHGWLVRGAFSMAMKSVPYRNDLLKQLGPGPEDKILQDSARYIESLDGVLSAVEELLASFGLNKDEKV